MNKSIDNKNIHTFYSNASHIAEVFLLAANLVPLLGVVYLGWDIVIVLAIYWAETAIIGLYNILKMLTVSPDAETKSIWSVPNYLTLTEERVSLAKFFTLHFFGFTLMHGLFFFLLFTDLPYGFNVNILAILFGAVSLFVSHGVSYVSNFIYGGEFQRITPDALFIQPYKRIVVMHLVILGAAFIAGTSGDLPMTGIIIFVGLKIFFDLIAHILEHKQFSQPSKREGRIFDKNKGV